MVSMLVAVDKNWGIGNKGDLLVKIPEDMRMFREYTTGNVMIMGRKTLESLPNGQPLKDRVNIVVTNNVNYKAPEGVIVVHSAKEALEKANEYKDMEIYNIGGGQLFKSMLEYCDVAYVTYIDHVYEADTHFMNLDEMPEWTLESESEEKTYFDLSYWFRKYVKKQ